MKERRSEKLTEYFVGPYKVKGIVSSNAIELELSKSIKIYPIVNVNRVWLYKGTEEDTTKTAHHQRTGGIQSRGNLKQKNN